MREYEKKFPDKIRCIWHEKNLRLGGARNTGIRFARSEFIYCVDSDDYIDLQLCEKMHNAIIAENADMAVCDWNRVENGIIIEDWLRNGKIDTSDLCERARNIKTSSACLIMIKKIVIENNNLYFPEHNGHEDALCILWYMASKKIIRINEALYYYVMRENSMTQDMKMENFNFCIQSVKYIFSLDYFKTLDASVKKLLFLFLSGNFWHCWVVCKKYPAEFVNFCNSMLDVLKIYKVSYDDDIYMQSEENTRLRDMLCFIESNISLPDFYLEFIVYYMSRYRIMQLKALCSWICLNKGKRLTIWGCGHFGRQNAENMSVMDIDFEITDANKRLHGQRIFNAVVKPWEDLKDTTDVVLVSARGIFEKVKDRLSKECPEIEVVDFMGRLEVGNG
jgi:glycosyltransferase involved in cell wall biosynthesis